MSRPARQTPRQRGRRGGKRGRSQNQEVLTTQEPVNRQQVTREMFANRYQANLAAVMTSSSPDTQRVLNEITKRAISACKVSQKDLDKRGVKRLDHILTVALQGNRSPQLDKYARRALKEKYLLTRQQLFPER